jgi:hypothetical protein
MRSSDTRARPGRPRPARLVGLAGTTLLALVLATLAHSHYARSGARGSLAESRSLSARLGLTDLALFTEARYTRHPTQADLHSAFQDHPAALEHFPSGSVLGPPQRLRHPYANLGRAPEVPD